MAGHYLSQHVEVGDDGRTVAVAEVTFSGGSRGTARTPARAGHADQRRNFRSRGNCCYS
jgi:hypothetical protein